MSQGLCRNSGRFRSSYWLSTRHFLCRKFHWSLSFPPHKHYLDQTSFWWVFYDTEMFCSEIYKQSQYLELRLGGSREWAWAFCWSSLLWAWGKKGKPKKQNCLVREPFVPRGLKQRCDETPSAAGIASQTQMLSSSDAFQRHVWEHRQGSDDDQSLSQLGVSRARHQPAGSPGCLRGSAPGSAHCLALPVLSSLLRITLTLACPMDLKNFPMDVQTCIMQLESCESCAHPRFGEETNSFPPCSPLPSPFPAGTHSQPSLHWKLAREPLV